MAKMRKLYSRIMLLMLLGMAIAPLAVRPMQATIIPFFAKTNTIAVPGTNFWFMDYAYPYLYATDSSLNKIMLYNSNFNNVENITGFDDPRGVLVEGDRIYVTDTGTDNLIVLENGVLVNSTPVTGPRALAVDSWGNILVSSNTDGVVYAYTPNFTLVDSMAVLGCEDIGVGPDGRIHITSIIYDNVSLFNPYYHFIRTYGDFNNPYGLEVNVDGYIFVADSGNDRVQVLSPDLQVVSTLTGYNYPWMLTVDEVGRLFVYDLTDEEFTTWDTNDLGDYDGPEISNIQITPLNPVAAQDVTVTATITDLVGIYNATLTYVLPSGNATVVMTGSGDTYSAVIPGQPANTVVNFSITAEDSTYVHWETTSLTYQYNVQSGPSLLPIDASLLGVAGLGLGVIALVVALMGRSSGGKSKRKR